MLAAGEICKLLQELAQRIELQGDNGFRARAYRRAAESLALVTVPIERLIAEARLQDIPGVGAAIASVITQLHRSGRYAALDALRKDFPVGVLEIVRIAPVTIALALSAIHGTVDAAPLRACAQVSALVDGEMSPLVAGQGELQRHHEGLRAQLRSCLSSRNICTVVSTKEKKQTLVAADVTADLPVQYISEHGRTMMVRSIPRVRNDFNEYCLISARSNGAEAGQHWDVYGWVLAPDSSEPLPLPKEVLDYEPTSGPSSLRGLASALWFFAQRMSGGKRMSARPLRYHLSLATTAADRAPRPSNERQGNRPGPR